jgi:cell division protein FtsL
MPISEVHKNKRTKNFALLFILIAIVATFFLVTIIKFDARNLNNVDVKVESEK